jgi:hypothetical protein
MPLQEVEKLFLNCRRSDIVGIEVIGLRLLFNLLSFVELLIIPSTTKLAQNALERRDVDLALGGLEIIFSIK